MTHGEAFSVSVRDDVKPASARESTDADAITAPVTQVWRLKWISARRARTLAIMAMSLALGILAWWALARFVLNPLLFASPMETLKAFRDTAESGQLLTNAQASLQRILLGYLIGCAVGIPCGLLIGSSGIARTVMEPWVGFMRFVPPIALLPLAIVWFGIGEESKYFLIAYSTAFIVLLNTTAGVYSVPRARLWAARSLGLKDLSVFGRVLLPSSVPFIITGMRLAMGNAFMTIVAAEMISSNSGLGYMIFNARQFFQNGVMFVGLLSIGILGVLADRLLSLIASVALRRFGLHDRHAA